MNLSSIVHFFGVTALALLVLPGIACGQESGTPPSATEAPAVPDSGETPTEQPAPAAEQAGGEAAEQNKLVRLSKTDKVWVDQKRKLVIVEGEIALTEGQLEMFACPKGTKEHESVVAVDSRAFVVHTALLAVGARSGHPVQFNPVFLIPTGDVIDVYVLWTDAEGKKHQVKAQEMVRDVNTQKAMSHNWVFGGSGFWVDETTNEQRYLGESGELICVSNFPTATMDLQIRSTDGNDALLYEAFTENIPPRGTKVKLVLVPRKKPGANAEKEKEAEPKAGSPKPAEVDAPNPFE